MKIGFIGNTNNFPFTLALAFRRLGHEIFVVVNQAYSLHRPENRYPEFAREYPFWLRDAAPMDESQYVRPNTKRDEIVRLMEGCDLVVANHLGHSLLPLIQRPSIALLTGSDLDYYADYKTVERFYCETGHSPLLSKEEVIKRVGRRLIAQQREGIRKAALFTYFPRGLLPHGDALLDEIGAREEKRIFFMMANVDRIQAAPAPRNGKLRVFCAARLTWRRPLAQGSTELDYKGSDVMARGLGHFYRTGAAPLDIRLVRKGLHVKETMDLLEEEGIGGCVTWMDELTQIQVEEEYRKADLVFDQFGKGPVGMAGLDAMATGRPLIADGQPEIFESMFGARAPICQARTPEEVSAHLERLAGDPSERERVGNASRAYVERYFSPRAAALLCLSKLGDKNPAKTPKPSSARAGKPSTRLPSSAVQDILARKIFGKAGRPGESLSVNERARYEEIALRQPEEAEWGVSWDEGLFLFSMAAALRPRRIVEVGTCSGISTSYLLGGVRERRVPKEIICHCFDILPYCYPTPTKRVGFAISEMAPEMLDAVEVHARRKASDAAEFCGPGSVELAFIDANHDHPAPWVDLIHLLPCLASESWVILHDLNLPRYLHARGDARIANHGAHWLYHSWPGAKFSIENECDNIGAIRLPENIEKLLPLAEKLFQYPNEAEMPGEEIERSWEILRSVCSQEGCALAG